MPLKKYLDYDGLSYLIQRIPRTKIEVTFDDVFAGETATCSMGSTTYTKTVPATEPYKLVFPINELGTWTIATSYLGDDYGTTIEVTAIGQTATGHVSHIITPEGATVTPTDDIQTWLKCACIEDKSYTTLEEVLADAVTFNALLADSNACDYMARSTTWASGIAGSASAMNLLGKYSYACDKLLADSTWRNAICNSEYFEYVLNVKVPNMTSDTAPSGECISGPYDGGRNPYNVFAGTNTGSFYSMTSTNNNYIGYHFPSPVKVVAFFIHYRQINASPMPKMTLQGSNDGTNWVSVGSSIQLSTSDQGSALTDTPSPDHIVSSNDNNAYSYWRLLFTDTSSGNSNFFRIQFYGHKSLVDSYIPLVPKLSSYNAPDGGVVSADSEYNSGYAAWRAFAVEGLTGDVSTHGWLPSGGTTNQGLVYDFGRSINVNKWAIASSYGTAGTTTTFTFSGSNDNVNYTQLDSQSVTCYTDFSTAQEYGITNPNSYRYYKVTISGATDTSNVGIRLQFYGKLDKTIVHSAAYDTVYYKNNGSNIPLCTTNSDGIGEFDISSLGSGTYTLYSSVAKDPDSLSNDYGKTIRTSESEYGHTTEMYVMPDTNVLYWYGHETPYAEDVVTANGWSWSGMTLSSPTHNSNYITLTSACYGSKNAITGTEKAVVEGVTAVSSVYGMIAAMPSKAISGQDWTEYSTSAKQVLSKSVSNKYVFVGSVNGRSSKLYAYWYE